MGSTRRLNYTVLGASVNAANRLCAEAGPGEVLIGEGTYREVSALRHRDAAAAANQQGLLGRRDALPGERPRGPATGGPHMTRAAVRSPCSSLVCGIARPRPSTRRCSTPPRSTRLGVRYVSPERLRAGEAERAHRARWLRSTGRPGLAPGGHQPVHRRARQPVRRSVRGPPPLRLDRTAPGSRSTGAAAARCVVTCSRRSCGSPRRRARTSTSRAASSCRRSAAIPGARTRAPTRSSGRRWPTTTAP